MERIRLPEMDELYNSLLKEKNRLNDLNYFIKTVVNSNNKNKIETLMSQYVWTSISDSTYVDTLELIESLKN